MKVQPRRAGLSSPGAMATRRDALDDAVRLRINPPPTSPQAAPWQGERNTRRFL